MTQETLCAAVGGIRDEYIAEAHAAASARPHAIRWIVLAACLCLLLGTLTVLAATGKGTALIAMFTGKTEPGSDLRESGYDLQVAVEKIPATDLTGEIQTVPEEITAQFETYAPYSSRYPGSWYRTFDTAADARAFVGLDRLQGLSWPLAEEQTVLCVLGDPMGKLQQVTLETAYRAGEIRLQAFSQIYTEHFDGEITLGTRTTEDLTFTETYYTTERGLTYHVLTSSAMESGYMGLDGYLVRDGVLYWLHIACLTADTEQAEALLHQWAAQF